VTREVDGGLETLGLALPAVVTCDLRLNAPRFTSLPNVMKARKMKIESFDPAAHKIDLTPSLTTISVAEPVSRAAGIVVSSVDELIDKLQNEAKVI
jgi:electron transfer flavoprotein beta subunit